MPPTGNLIAKLVGFEGLRNETGIAQDVRSKYQDFLAMAQTDSAADSTTSHNPNGYDGRSYTFARNACAARAICVQRTQSARTVLQTAHGGADGARRRRRTLTQGQSIHVAG